MGVDGPVVVTLREGTVGDVEEVHALEVRVFGVDAWSEESVREELTGPRRSAVLACDADRVVLGYLVTSTAGDLVDLQRVAVRPDHQRRGLARLLLRAVSAEAEGERMLLEVSAANTAALAFYAAEGFTEIARRGHYYRDGSDAVVMERALPAEGTRA
jgi:ribosomal-protein-alanine acetyltransferase